MLNLTKAHIKWTNENEHGKEWYYTECYDDYLDLITTDESSGGKSEAESHNDYAPHEITYLNFFFIIVHEILYHIICQYILQNVKIS